MSRHSTSSTSPEPVCRSCRSQRSRYLTCTLPDKEQNIGVSRLKLGNYNELGDGKQEPYNEKFLSRKLMSFHWEEASMTLPGKSDLLETICFRIENNVSPDISVRIKDKKFMCHSIVLQCYMDLHETGKEIVLNEKKISYETFEEIYQWMLLTPEKSHLKLSRENVLYLLQAANYLGIQELECQCWVFIKSKEIFNEATAFFLFLNAKVHLTQESLRDEIIQLMLPRIRYFFLILVSSKNWLELDVQHVCALLSSNHIRVRCELEIFLSAVRWLMAHWSARKSHAVHVMQCVRFCLMSPFHLVEICESSEFTEITLLPGVQKLITEGMDVATVKSTHHLVANNRKELSHMLGVTEQSLRHYLKHQTELYENQGLIYRDFMKQLNKIKEGEISLNEEIASSEETVKMRRKSTNRGASLKKRGKSSHDSKPVTEGSVQELKDTAVEVEKVKSSTFVKPNEDNQSEKKSNRLNERNETAEQTVSSNYSSIPSSVEHKLPPLSDSESSAFMEDSEAVLVLGGVDAHASYTKNKKHGREIHRYNPFVNTWQQIGEMPVPRHHHATVYLNGLVYIAGGVDPSRNDGTELVCNTVWALNPRNKQWVSVAPMLHARKIFSLVTCQGRMYAIGGQDSSKLLSSVECYDPVSQTWREVAPLQSARMGTAAAEINGKIWVAGGYTGDKMNPVTDRVECYDPGSNQWTCMSSLRYPRYLATLVTVKEKLYLIGGASQSDSGRMHSVSDVDRLDVKEQEWRYITELVLPRHGHCASILSSQILIIGGVTTVHKRTLKSVECWCFDRQAWIKGVSGLPASILGHSCVALPLKTFLQ